MREARKGNKAAVKETAPNVYFMHFTNGGNNCQADTLRAGERGGALSDADENRNENINLSPFFISFCLQKREL